MISFCGLVDCSVVSSCNEAPWNVGQNIIHCWESVVCHCLVRQWTKYQLLCCSQSRKIFIITQATCVIHLVSKWRYKLIKFIEFEFFRYSITPWLHHCYLVIILFSLKLIFSVSLLLVSYYMKSKHNLGTYFFVFLQLQRSDVSMSRGSGYRFSKSSTERESMLALRKENMIEEARR